MKRVICVLLMWPILAFAAPPYDGGQMPGPPVRQFLQQCSNIEVHDATTNSFAYGVCLGYARGLVEGHQVTVELERLTSTTPSHKPRQLWCVPPNATGATLMQTILVWIERNPVRYKELMTRFVGTNAAAAVIFAAAIQGYPC
jgi:hypothetical protein